MDNSLLYLILAGMLTVMYVTYIIKNNISFTKDKNDDDDSEDELNVAGPSNKKNENKKVNE